MIHQFLQAWRRTKKLTVSALAEKSQLTPETIEAAETGELDPSVSTLEALATGLEVPPSWLYGDPSQMTLLLTDSDEDNSEVEMPQSQSPDPVAECILRSAQRDRDLYVLLTALLQSGDPKLLRAAEVNLRSLLKQAKTATVPWQSRLPGHFEPPSD